MNIKILNDCKTYLSKIVVYKDDYHFYFKSIDGEYNYIFFTFQKFKCSLQCRLQHYKDFKKFVFGECTTCNSNSKCGRHLRKLRAES